ncbi:aminotransferase class IV [Synechococcus sp. CS-1328]|nr:aminotransferase class IV [Synechococcus sp. CS-1328]
MAWIDTPSPQGCWGHPDDLALPLSDRGLLLADGLFETLLIEAGQPHLLAAHLERWHRSAALLGLAPPPDEARLVPLIAEAVARSGINSGALRLNWTRGSSGRGLAVPSHSNHRFWLNLSAATACFEPVRVIVSPSETRSATSLLSRCKTFAYGPAIQARRQAAASGADDALLPSSAGGLCCGTSANLLLLRGGRWLTPPLSSGCLPGVMRQQTLRHGLAKESPISEQDLASSDGALLLSSLGCRPISHLGHTALPSVENVERFWRQLLSPAH